MTAPTQPAPWITAQTQTLLGQKGHAWLIHGPSGLGQYDLALALVSAWLCEQPLSDRACGQCGSCHAVSVRTHADLLVVMPETVLLDNNWPLGEKAQTEIDKKDRKPSKEIRVDAMREAIEFCQRTSARGRGKAVMIFPAEDMNPIAANALLKTLEEPPGDTQFILATSAAQRLMPTIRSRCLAHTMVWPARQEALSWLQSNGVPADQTAVLLSIAAGRPLLALEYAQTGRDGAMWSRFPRAMALGDVAFVKDWSASMLVDALQKLCHDLLVRCASGEARFFTSADLPPVHPVSAMGALSHWQKQLTHTQKTVSHPFHAGLMLEALVSQAQISMAAGRSTAH